MLSETLALLASSSATTFAGAMATDGWHAARAGLVRLFARGGAEKQARIEAQLDSNADRVARGDDPDRVRRGFVGAWQLELEDLLEELPEVEAELRALVAEIQAGLPAAQQSWVQTNTAHDNASIFAAQGGNVIYHQSERRDD